MSVIKVPKEHDEQVAFIEWSKMYFENLPAFFFAIPNGARMTMGVAVKSKKEGLTKGVPDLFLPHARLGYHGLFIEMKRQKGGTVSKEQKEVIAILKGLGYCVMVCKGDLAAWEVTKEYMLGDGDFFTDIK